MIRKLWSEEDRKYLKDNCQRQSVVELAQALGRNINSVGSYLRLHKFERRYVKRKWTKGEVFKLYLYVERYGPHIIAKKMGRSLKEIRRKLHHLKLTTRTEVYSELKAKQATGYHEYQLQRARDALGQVWLKETFKGPGKRPKTRYSITQKQLDALCEHLKTDPLKHTLKRLRAA